jgi:glycerophosphoryl diester phosphodiesterase
VLKIGHRGAPELAPPNTMAGFRRAVEIGCDWVECDCRVSSNGVVVLAHDAICFASGVRYRVDRYPAETLASLDLGAGEGVPTLAELVEWASSAGIGVLADVKTSGIERDIGETLAPMPKHLKLVAGADEAGRKRFRELFSDLPLSLTLNRLHAITVRSHLARLDTQAVTLEHSLLTPSRVARLKADGVLVLAWTVDDVATMIRLVETGVDGIISNRPDLLAELA